VVPHPARQPAYKIYGEEYARLLNASFVVPTCGSISKVVVMKHLEIPAARACLVTEKTSSVESFGFRDMENCVFADQDDILDKLEYLFANRDILERITNNGHDLVHSRHTAKQRKQILQWLQLHRVLKPGQRIVQPSLLDDLEIVEADSGRRNGHIINTGLDRHLLRQGDEKLIAGKYIEAERLYDRCLEYIYWMPEPKLRLALCKLYRGDSVHALLWLIPPIRRALGMYEASSPDPVEWAYLLIAFLCRGEFDAALRLSQCFPTLRHVELDRARWVVDMLASRSHEGMPLLKETQTGVAYNKSIHQLPHCNFDEYLTRICSLFRACKQRPFARVLAKSRNFETLIEKPHMRQEPSVQQREEDHNRQPSGDEMSHLLETLTEMQRSLEVKMAQRFTVKLAEQLKGTTKKFICSRPVLKINIKNFAYQLHSRLQSW
jgi:hypothetical protein